MLLSTIIGDQTTVSNDWTIEHDSYDNRYLANESLRQKIRMGKNTEEKLDRVFSSANMASYEISDNIVFSNSNKNMNLLMLNFFSKDPEERKNHKDQHILYVTMSIKNYMLTSYELIGDGIIVQTYRRKGEFQGCAIQFTELNQELMVIYAKDFEMNRFVKIYVSVDGEGRVQVDKLQISDREELKKARKKYRNLTKGNRLNHFKMSCPDDWLPTSTYIVNGLEEGLVDAVKDLTKEIHNVSIMVLPAGDSTFTDGTDEEKEALDNMFKEALIDERVRAVTVVGARLPYDFCKKYKILYLFAIDDNTGGFVCLKSN